MTRSQQLFWSFFNDFQNHLTLRCDVVAVWRLTYLIMRAILCQQYFHFFISAASFKGCHKWQLLNSNMFDMLVSITFFTLVISFFKWCDLNWQLLYPIMLRIICKAFFWNECMIRSKSCKRYTCCSSNLCYSIIDESFRQYFFRFFVKFM